MAIVKVSGNTGEGGGGGTDAKYLGVYADLTALQTAHPTANTGDTATVTSPNGNLFWWNGAAWADTGTGYLGDMLKAVYDTTAINADAFTMPNMIGMSQGADGQLYSVDSTRGNKQLGLVSYPLQWGKNNAAGNEYLRFGGDARDGAAGVTLIKPGTIVGISILGTNATNVAEFEIEVDGVQVGSTYTTTAGVYVDATLNIDVDLGEYVNLFANNVATELEDVYAVIWIKDRL